MASVDFRVRKGIDAQHLVLQDQSTDPANVTDQTKIFAKTAGGGGSGIFFRDGVEDSEELVSRKKAITFSLVF
tara:strand:- start:1791 stop:2009 length:219 start_codon:yes stop_codon:yes gene_type:complete